MEQGSGWEAGGDALLLFRTVSRAVGCSRAAYAQGFAAVSHLPLPSRDNQRRPRAAESPTSVRRGELRHGRCSVLSLQKTHGEEAKGPLKVEQ